MDQWVPLVDYIQSHSCSWTREPEQALDPALSDNGAGWGIHLEDTPPYNTLLGPVFSRGESCGLIRHKGKTLCQWGDTQRPEMTFSVTKTYLAILAGIAYDQGLIRDLDLPISQTLSGHGIEMPVYQGEHNGAISWRQALQFTSEWHGHCFGVPDQVDHYRVVGMQKNQTDKDSVSHKKGHRRPLHQPGTYWEYNDVRINQFSLALMHVFDQALPDVFDKEVMQKLGIDARATAPLQDERAPSSGTWQWFGYRNSWIDIKGRSIQSVPGGGHWGGGMVICAEHQARIAELLLNKGRARQTDKADSDQQILSAGWIEQMQKPCAIAPFYGLFTWLNTDHCISKSAPQSSYFSMGIGGQLIMHDPENDLLAVLRWIDSDYTNDIIGMIYTAFGQN